MNVNAIFEAFNRASDYVGLRDEQMRKREQLQSVTARRCGNCEHWMKTTCVPEKRHGQFKSCASIACGAFQQGWSARDLEKKFSSELAEIDGRIAAFVGAGQRTGADHG